MNLESRSRPGQKQLDNNWTTGLITWNETAHPINDDSIVCLNLWEARAAKGGAQRKGGKPSHEF